MYEGSILVDGSCFTQLVHVRVREKERAPHAPSERIDKSGKRDGEKPKRFLPRRDFAVG
jgi:hypothetical protein